MRKYVYQIGLLFVVAVLFSGCFANLANSVGVDISHAKDQNEKFLQGDYNASAEIAVSDKDKEAKLDEANLLPTLQAGNSYLYALDFNKSFAMLDEAEAIIKFHHEETLAGSTADYIAQLTLNDAAIDYHVTVLEAIMINTYKALDEMSTGDLKGARVELNRAVDRQRRAKETYAKVIAKQKEALAEKSKDTGGSFLDKSINNPQIKTLTAKEYAFLDEFKPYPEFINPFTTYLAGLFFALEGDNSKSMSLLREVSAMMPENSVAKSDYEMVSNNLKGKKSSDRYVWVIYENGLAPMKKEFKINLPLFLFTGKVAYTGIALPTLEKRSQATPNLMVLSGSTLLGETSVIADMDRVAFSEFKYTYNDVVVRAIFSAVLKTAAQYAVNDRSAYAGLAMAAMQFLTTHADTRTWNSLPKEFQVAKVKIPADNKLLLKAGTHNMNVDIIPSAKNAIVYVRLPAPLSKPSVNVINF